MISLLCNFLVLKNLLVLGKVWPEPRSSAAGQRIMQLIELFKSFSFDITFASPAAESDFSEHMGVAGEVAFSVQINDSSFDQFIKEKKPDIVLFDRFTTEEQFGWRILEHCPSALRILDTEDLHFLRAAREKTIHENITPDKRDYNSLLAKREIASIYRCDLSLMISTYEMNFLQEQFSIKKDLLLYIPLFAEKITDEKSNTWPAFESRKDFYCIGNFLHEPNWDAVKYLKKEIWPLIRKKLPGVSVDIYGAYPTNKVFELNDPKTGFLIKGRAEDPAAISKSHKVCLAPLRFGAGLKGKLLEAMQNGTPNVTTPIGAEGLNLNSAWSGIISNSAEEFANAAGELYITKDLWLNAQNAGIKIINHHFLREQHEKIFQDRLTDLIQNIEHYRHDNFIGGMLNHHTLQSTKYMSQWIEAKNQSKDQSK